MCHEKEKVSVRPKTSLTFCVSSASEPEIIHHARAGVVRQEVRVGMEWYVTV